MRVFLTGSKGFTGAYMRQTLEARGHDVIGLSCDLRDAAAMDDAISSSDPDAVVHLAAQAFVAHESVKDFYDINLQGTNTLLETLQRRADSLSSVLLASTASVYGNNTEGLLSEDMPPRPANHYAVSKLAMEMSASLFANLPIVIARPFNYTGIGQKAQFVIPKVVSHFRERQSKIELGNIEVFREFGDVRSVVQIYADLIETPPVGRTLNVCTGHAHSLRDVIDKCRELTGHDLEIHVNSKFVRPNEVVRVAGDPKLLHELVPSRPHYRIEDTLKWMLTE